MIERKYSPTTERILARAMIEAAAADKDSVEPTHLLLAILQESRTAAALMLQQKGITEVELRDCDFKK